MKLLALIVLVCPLAGLADTFELQDPAQEIFDDLEKKNAEEPPPRRDVEDTGDLWDGQAVGKTTCSEFLTFNQERSEWYWSNLYWLQGFIDGNAYRQTGTLGDSDLSHVDDLVLLSLWIEKYCIGNRLDSLAQAADAYVEEYGKRE